MQIYDGRGRVLRPNDDGVWVGSTFLYYRPSARQLGLPSVELAEPLRVQLAFGEKPDDSERELVRIRRCYMGAAATVCDASAGS